jgi:hypothetical protein
MKKIVLSSILLAAIFAGCGGDSACCEVSKTEAPTLTPDPIKESGVKEEAPKSVNPTAIISLSDSAGPLVVHTNHTFSCADSHDNDTLGSGKEIVSCEWSIQSYRLDENGALVPYRNCTEEVMDNKPIYICDKVVKIVATLKVTDNDGETDVTTTEYLDFAK